MPGTPPFADAEFIRAMPKVELHVHLEGTLRPATLFRLAEQNRLSLPFKNPAEIEEKLYRYRNFQDFIAALLLGVHCLRQLEDFRNVVVDLGAEMARQNIRYAEIIWTPQFYLRLGLPFDILLEALNEGRREAGRQWGVEMRWITDLVRSVPAPAWQVVKWACSEKARCGGVVALGLGGPESGYPPALFSDHFCYARRRGLPANPHAGEGAGPESIRAAITFLGAKRIGHGVRAKEDPALVQLLAAQGLPLEVCPTSNLRLGLYSSYASHPLRQLVEAGCVVTINSDDPALFQTTLTAEYLHAVTDCGLSLTALKESVLNAVRSCYLSDFQRQEMLTAFHSEFYRLNVAAGTPALSG